MAKESRVTHWEQFWEDKNDMDVVYPSVTNSVEEWEKVTTIRDKKFMEVGAGTGRDSILLAQKGATVFVIDYADNALGIIKKIAQEKGVTVHLIKGDAFKVPVKTACLDGVFHQGLIEHFRDPSQIIAENARVLKKGGQVLADVPQRYHPYTLLKHTLIAFNAWFAGWETEFSMGELRTAITAPGLKVVHQYGDWMTPSLCYRLFRELLLRLKITRLHRFPKPLPVVGALRTAFFNWFRTTKFAANTFNAIGVIGEKE